MKNPKDRLNRLPVTTSGTNITVATGTAYCLSLSKISEKLFTFMKEVNQKPCLALVVPCYNESAGLDNTISQLIRQLEQLIEKELISPLSYALFIDDGSRDHTWEIIQKNSGIHVKGIKLSSNSGHQKALLAGLHYCTNRCDCCISLDADLQDDIQVIENMILSYNDGNKIVYGVRDNRSIDSVFKKSTAEFFYKLLKWMNINIVFNHADFRLADNHVLNELSKYGETHLFLRGIFPLMGFKHSLVYYNRLDRNEGETKYSFTKMARLAIDGITSFSGFPLKLITITGFAVFFGCLLAMAWVFIVLLRGKNAPGWASITLPIYFLGGIQLLALGVMGTYINKVFEESKKRPLYHIEQTI
jgi:glycosyltransferase involved in cell wall biosynthesis